MSERKATTRDSFFKDDEAALFMSMLLPKATKDVFLMNFLRFMIKGMDLHVKKPKILFTLLLEEQL